MNATMSRTVVMSIAMMATLFSSVSVVKASGNVGLYAVLEKVVFEPNETTPERVQLWGAFAFVDDRINVSTAPNRGFVYFQLPANPSAAQKANILREWADLKSAAGTGQAVAFGSWFYVSGLARGQQEPPGLVQVQIQSPSDSPSKPANYTTNAGVVKVPATGTHAGIVEQLKSLIEK